VNEKPTNALIIQSIGAQYSPTCFGTLKCHHHGFKHNPAEIGAQCRGMVGIPTITPPVTIFSSHPSLLPTTLGTYLSRIVVDSLLFAF
jgi:hypothetical protein